MSVEQPAVSVVMANYNGAPHLADAIRSVLDQSLADLELIVVDDASTDDSVAVIKAAAAGDPRLRLFVQPKNRGPGAARNRGLAEARGPWIAIFDSDDLMACDRLERLVALAEAEGADLVADNLLVFEEAGGPVFRPLLAARAYQRPRWVTLSQFIGSARMYARRPSLGYLKPVICARALARTGVRYREDLRIGEDYDLVLRLLAQHSHMLFEPAPLYRYRRHGSSTSQVMRCEHVVSMLAADAAFDRDFPDQRLTVRRAQAKRRRSLRAALSYGEVVERLKQGDLTGAVRHAAGAPAAWPLLILPLKARMQRGAARLRSALSPPDERLAA